MIDTLYYLIYLQIFVCIPIPRKFNFYKLPYDAVAEPQIIIRVAALFWYYYTLYKPNNLVTSTSTNAGVHAITGFEFQSHCAICIILDDYDKFKQADYFLSMEHWEDYLFCFMNSNGHVIEIKTYQAKKSSTKWSLNEVMYEIVEKIVDAGLSVRVDPITKSAGFIMNLHFISNNEMSFTATAGDGKTKITKIVNETNTNVSFSQLHTEIQNLFKIHERFNNKQEKLDELANVSFCYIDLSRTVKAQQQTIKGKLSELFNNKIYDTQAALDTLLLLFSKIKAVFNQGSIPRLLDPAKRISGQEIADVLKVVTSQKRAYSLWRDQKYEIAKKLAICLADQEEFEQQFIYSIDLFKDKSQTQHAQILTFVENNKHILSTSTSEAECLEALNAKFKAECTCRLTPVQLKATLFAALIQIL
ncbi:dsDNA nuclease domain-containing protein [Chitinophaga rhizophila]|uniref:DUF4297 domain-containing protein n=1 Tax=Chitinophaga rhizophila TaxID=2866212 RepID=A0ABS7G9P8_9BACT|nr:dsDNA nuclease domain-containing protein [Chitinophaga rhizophila]MBW8683519.1 DUF4297 domain-containing protein [Chitinophaga rhizophila]